MTPPLIAVLNGPNLNLLGAREPEVYGHGTLADLEADLRAAFPGVTFSFFQSNHEGEFVEELHTAPDFADGLVLNPGAWTHYSWAIRDALEVAALPAVEVHLSDVDAREEFRRTSVIGDLCIARVAGRGVEGYNEALAALKEALP